MTFRIGKFSCHYKTEGNIWHYHLMSGKRIIGQIQLTDGKRQSSYHLGSSLDTPEGESSFKNITWAKYPDKPTVNVLDETKKLLEKEAEKYLAGFILVEAI